MVAQVTQNEASFRIRHLLPVPMRRRYRLGLMALGATVVVLIVPSRRGLTMVDAAVAWLRERRPDLTVTVTEAARELGVHRLGR